MKVRILVKMVGTETTREIGDELELDKKEATRLLSKGFAELVLPAAKAPAKKRTTRKKV